MNWQYDKGDWCQAPLSFSGDYVISHRPGEFLLRYRPPGNHHFVGDYPDLATAKEAAEAHAARRESCQQP